DRSERRHALGLFAILLLRSLVEALGIASIMPFIAIAANPGLLEHASFLHRAFVAIGGSGESAFTVFLGGLMFAAIICRNGTAALATWASQHSIWRIHHSLSVRLANDYLAKPYTFFLKNHSAAFRTDVLDEVGVLTRSVVQ